MAYVDFLVILRVSRSSYRYSAVNLHAMRMGPGKHLKGKTLMNGVVTPEEVSRTVLILNARLTLPLVRLLPRG